MANNYPHCSKCRAELVPVPEYATTQKDGVILYNLRWVCPKKNWWRTDHNNYYETVEVTLANGYFYTSNARYTASQLNSRGIVP